MQKQTKTYSMEQHNFAIKANFRVEYAFENKTEPYSIEYVTGFVSLLKCLTFETQLDLDKLFELFVDRKLQEYLVLNLYQNGDIMQATRIVLED